MADTNKVLQTLANSFVPAEINNDMTLAIKNLVIQINDLISEFNNSRTQYDNYNQAYHRFSVYNQIIKENNKLDISNEASEQRADQSIAFNNYRSAKMLEDENVIKTLYDYMTVLTEAGYSYIMKLRELLTGQTIIYAIEHIDKGSISHQAFLNEDQYLTLFKIQRSRDLKTISKVTRPSHFAVTLDTASILNQPGIDINNSHDWAYQMLANYTQAMSDKGHVIKNNERWEMYTEVKAFFKNTPPSSEKFNNYLSSFLEAKHAWLRKINTKGNVVTSQRNVMFQLSTLAFYQGGDSTFSETVLIQNKSTGAAIRVGTIYNALKTIQVVFQNFPNLDVNQVKTLFTANFQDIPNQIVNEAFLKANKYAQEHIEKVVANLKIG